jgi:hypothetical protein
MGSAADGKPGSGAPAASSVPADNVQALLHQAEGLNLNIGIEHHRRHAGRLEVDPKGAL